MVFTGQGLWAVQAMGGGGRTTTRKNKERAAGSDPAALFLP